MDPKRSNPARHQHEQHGVCPPGSGRDTLHRLRGWVYCHTRDSHRSRIAVRPGNDTATTLTSADNWPGDTAGTILPGGFAVANNKLYILGGFNINVASTNQIWEFDPTAAAGSRWHAKVNTPEGIMYAATAPLAVLFMLEGHRTTREARQ